MFDFFHKQKSSADALFYHTDMHCHLVPGIDDGQQEAGNASKLVERQREWGFTRVFATPHVTQDTFENTPETIEPAFEKLCRAVADRGVDIELHHSAEYRLDGFFQEQLAAGNLRPFPNGYLLVENSFVQEAWNLDATLFDLKLKGYKPILAHPERYGYYFAKPERYRQLKESGTLFQINLLSLAGHYGKGQRKMAEELIDKGWVDFIGTDMHNDSHCASIDAYLRTKDFARLEKRLGDHLLNDTAF